MAINVGGHGIHCRAAPAPISSPVVRHGVKKGRLAWHRGKRGVVSIMTAGGVVMLAASSHTLSCCAAEIEVGIEPY